MTFPNEPYRLLCEKNTEMLRSLIPGIDSGDWVAGTQDDWIFLVVEADLESETLHLYGGPDVGMAHSPTLHWQQRFIPLPSQRQLEAMLEERGYRWDVGIKAAYGTQDKYRACAFTDKEMAAYLINTGESWSPTKARIIWTGPDPETALLRALLEVLEEEA